MPNKPAPDPKLQRMTLREAFTEVLENRWAGRRCEAAHASQCRIAMVEVAQEAMGSKSSTADYFVRVCDVTQAHLRPCVRRWTARHLAYNTIAKRLMCLSALGVDVKGCYPHNPKQLKWWLPPAEEDRLMAWLEQRRTAGRVTANELLAGDFVRWTTKCGLRVEESLALTWSMCHQRPDGGWSITVPGRKTNGAQATIPLSSEASAVLSYRRGQSGGASEFVFPISYGALREVWQVFREVLGVSGVKGATLKSLRRTAARHLHVERNMPLDVVRQYLRHSDVSTTMGYLRLVGGYGEEEMRRWL
jgi:integrase